MIGCLVHRKSFPGPAGPGEKGRDPNNFNGTLSKMITGSAAHRIFDCARAAFAANKQEEPHG
ncbi:MAG TPA: hypothetical protein DDZ83_10300 [Nitrospinae bacterium]|nr:hypothetical protein [Nitrospinota bacterium]